VATMQAYGHWARLIVTGLCAVAALGLTGCGLLDEPGNSSPIVIPGTDELSTERPASISAATSATRSPDRTEVSPADSLDQAIRQARRVSVSNFRIGAVTATGEREDGLSGVHFSTPDRAVRCSTGNNGSDALACVGRKVDGPRRAPSDAPGGCDWDPDLVTLDAENIGRGGCANLYPVLYRSRILEFDSALTANRFSCLSRAAGLYCLESSSGDGFAITRDGFEEINGDDRAPGASSSSAESSAVPSR